jgi:hypothetical protein
MPETRNAQGMVEWIIWEMRKYATCSKESKFPVIACMRDTRSRCIKGSEFPVIARRHYTRSRCPSKAAGMVVAGREAISAYLLVSVFFGVENYLVTQ